MRRVWSERSPLEWPALTEYWMPLHKKHPIMRVGEGLASMNLQELLLSLKEYGPPGLFLAAFISNLIPGFPAIYLTFVGAYGALVHDPLDQIITVVLAGLGAGLGKVVVFSTSNFLAGRSERVQQRREEYSWLISETKLGVFILVLLFAALPLPDDVLYIPLGISGFSILWFAAAVIIGKILLTAFVLFLGRTYWALVAKYFGGGQELTGENLALMFLGIIVGTLIITWIIFSMDWKRIYFAYKEQGLLTGARVFLEELFHALTLKRFKKNSEAKVEAETLGRLGGEE